MAFVALSLAATMVPRVETVSRDAGSAPGVSGAAAQQDRHGQNLQVSGCRSRLNNRLPPNAALTGPDLWHLPAAIM